MTEQCRSVDTTMPSLDVLSARLGRRPTGGQSKFNPARAAAIVTAIEAGSFAGIAAESVGISRWTLNRWRQRGERELERASEFDEYPDILVLDVIDDVEAKGGGIVEGLSIPCVEPFAEAEWPYVLLMHHLKRAQARAASRAVQGIFRQGSEGKWQALAWWLERTQPAQYGRHLLYATSKSGDMAESSPPLAAQTTTSQELMARIGQLRNEGSLS